MTIGVMLRRFGAMAVAAVLAFGATDAGAVTVVKPLGTFISNGGSVGGTFNIAAVEGFRVVSATLSASGHSSANYIQTIGNYSDPVFVGVFNIGTPVSVYRRDRTITRIDSVVDEIRLVTLNGSTSVAVTDHGVFSQQQHNHNEMVNPTTRIEYIDHIETDAWTGALAPSMSLGALDVASMNDTGMLFWGVSAPVGRFTLANVTLNYELEAIPVPASAPEPSTWAMMILGFGLAGAGLRRRPRGGLAA